VIDGVPRRDHSSTCNRGIRAPWWAIWTSVPASPVRRYCTGSRATALGPGSSCWHRTARRSSPCPTRSWFRPVWSIWWRRNSPASTTSPTLCIARSAVSPIL